MNMAYKILIVEDDDVICNAIGEKLKEWGYEISAIHDFKSVMELFTQKSPQLVLLDIKLPYHNGFYWCQRIREISNVPIIFISSYSDKMNMVLAINKGGDDYITKPFDLDVLVAKVQALIRRSYDFIESSEMLICGELRLILGEGCLMYKSNKIDLTKNEFKIIEILIRKKGQIVTKKELMMKLWDNDEFVNDNTLTTNMMRLRNKLRHYGIDNLIRTQKGKGYILDND